MQNNFYPGSIMLILGYKCTNNCDYCYLQHNGAKLNQNMNEKTLQQAIQWYSNWLQQPNLPYLPSISLIGGEPLCYWDELNLEKNLSNLMKIVHKYNKELRIVSNGYLWKNKHLNFVKEQGISVDISLDGYEEAHNNMRKTKSGMNTWQEAYNTINALKRDGNNYRVRATIGKQNINNAYEMYLFLYNEGFKRYGLEIDTFHFWSTQEISKLSIQYDKILKHYIKHYDPNRSCFSLDRVLKLLAPNLIQSKNADSQFLRPCSMAILPDGEMKVNHNFPVWADKETAKLFSVGQLPQGLNNIVINEYLNHFGMLTESSYYAQNEKNVCQSCPVYSKFCQTPWNNNFLPKSVWPDNYDIQCYALRLIAVFGLKYLKEFGYVK